MIDKNYITFKKEPFYKLAKDKISAESVVLDVGAGDGGFANFCKRSDFYLLDGNEETVSYLKTKFKNVILGSLPVLPFKNKFFDLIHCSHVVEHLEPAIFYETIKEMDRCLKEGGYLVISAPLMWQGFYNDLSHTKPYNPQVFISYLCNNKSSSRSRGIISSSYKVETLIYRYRDFPLDENLYSWKRNNYTRILFWLFKLLKVSGLTKYEKTGYTIVLKKN